MIMQYVKKYRKMNIPSGSVRISITNACNMKCVYCHNEGQEKTCENIYMDIKDIKMIISSTMEYGMNKLRITGGEPLIHPFIIQILEMIKNEIKIKNVGINTNGTESELLYRICKEKLVNQIVIGMDYFDGKISKMSQYGKSSAEIKSIILDIVELNNGISVNIDYVFHNDLEDLISIVSWCLLYSINLRILEPIDINNNSYIPDAFDQLYIRVRDVFELNEGITVDLNERFLFNREGTHIYFYQSHCNRKECNICKNIHLRITAEGNVKPCFFNSEYCFPLLNGEFEYNMNRAIINLGTPPFNTLL